MTNSTRIIGLLVTFLAFGCGGDSAGPPVLAGTPSTPGETGGEGTEAGGRTTRQLLQTRRKPRECSTDEECSSAGLGPCEVAVCNVEAGSCETGPAPAETSCDDGLSCTENDTCGESGECAGTPVDCEDGDPCTTNACTEEDGCTLELNSDPCDDGDACTTDDACDQGDCYGTENLCDDGDPCTTGTCDDESGDCSYENNTGFCDDGDPCSGNDTCLDGTCAGTPLDCDDGNSCTEDACDPAQGFCTHAFNEAPCGGEDAPCEPCDDGDTCTVEDVCKNGQCIGDANPCDDGDGCTDDSCDPVTGCVHVQLRTLQRRRCLHGVGNMHRRGPALLPRKIAAMGNPARMMGATR